VHPFSTARCERDQQFIDPFMLKAVFTVLTITSSVMVVSTRTINNYKPQDQNHAPVVKLTVSAANAVLAAGAPINYTVTVADQEDGDSKYDEINGKEVLVEVRYLGGKNSGTAKTASGDHPGLNALRSSNCFNCHNFNSKLIGPSFHEIAEKYPLMPVNMQNLQKHIKEGSTGIWGKVTMPTHPELSAEDTRNIVQWILKYGKDANLNYSFGLEGAIKLADDPTTVKKGSYLVTASYIDHGAKSSGGKKLKGQDVVKILVK